MVTNDEDLVPISEAARRTGVNRTVIHRRVNSGELETFARPANHRVRLVRLADVEALKVLAPLAAEERRTAGRRQEDA